MSFVLSDEAIKSCPGFPMVDSILILFQIAVCPEGEEFLSDDQREDREELRKDLLELVRKVASWGFIKGYQDCLADFEKHGQLEGKRTFNHG